MITGILFLLALICLLPIDAYAYLDPGTGSVILQVVLAGILGAVFTLKTYWRAVKAWFAQLFGNKDKDKK